MANAELWVPAGFKMPVKDVKVGKLYIFDGVLPPDDNFGNKYSLVTVLNKGLRGPLWTDEVTLRSVYTWSQHSIISDHDDMVPLAPVELLTDLGDRRIKPEEVMDAFKVGLDKVINDDSAKIENKMLALGLKEVIKTLFDEMEERNG